MADAATTAETDSLYDDLQDVVDGHSAGPVLEALTEALAAALAQSEDDEATARRLMDAALQDVRDAFADHWRHIHGGLAAIPAMGHA